MTYETKLLTRDQISRAADREEKRLHKDDEVGEDGLTARERRILFGPTATEKGTER